MRCRRCSAEHKESGTMMPREFHRVAVALALVALLSAGGTVTSSAQFPMPTMSSAQIPTPTVTGTQTPVRTATPTPGVGAVQTVTTAALSQEQPFLLTATLLGIAE